MGNFISTYTQEETPFKQFPALDKMNMIVNEMITTGNMFSNKHYNINQNSCQKYQMVLQSELEKSFQVDLKGIEQKIFMIDPDFKTKINGKEYSKKQLCQQVYNYYRKILNILVSIKMVFDLEHESAESILNVVLNNIIFTKNNLGIQYCSINQGSSIDVSQMSGFKYITENLYTKDESKQFMAHIKNIIQNENFNKVKGVIGNEQLLNDQQVKNIYSGFFDQKLPTIKDQSVEFSQVDLEQYLQPENTGIYGNIDTTVKWIKNNLIVSSELCDIKSRKVAFVENSNWAFKNALNTLINNAKTNISKLLSIVKSMISYDFKKKRFQLVFLEVEQIQKYEHLSKLYIQQFYLQILSDYKRLMAIAIKDQK